MAVQHAISPALVGSCPHNHHLEKNYFFFVSLDLLSSAPSVDEIPCNCTDNQVCVRAGRFGERKCVDCTFHPLKILILVANVSIKDIPREFSLWSIRLSIMILCSAL